MVIFADRDIPDRRTIMKEAAERVVRVGFTRSPRKIFDEVEQVTADMIRQGWTLTNTVLEDGLGKIHLFFEREVVDAPVAEGH